jgi:tetratricopeptide (TPR) repeat protein
MQMDFPNSQAYLTKYSKLLQEADSLSENNHLIFKNKKMQFLETGKYSDYKFRLFIDLFAKIITDINNIKQLSGLDTLNVKVLDKFLANKEELLQMGWFNDFELLTSLINKDIKAKGKVFGDSVMANLQRQSAVQPQPYHAIFLGFNELERSQMLFKSYLNEAIKSCTDINMISNLEMWFLSYNATFEGLSNETLNKINDGIALVNEKKWDEAAFVFDILTKQAGNVPIPWYYSGIVLYEKGESFTAELKFNIALERYPKYIAPRLHNFKLMYDSGRFAELLPKVTEAINANDIWLFHFWFAKTLLAMQKYDEAIETLTNSCIKLNPYDVQEYFLLGDAYLAKKNFTEAEKSFMKTMEVNPYYDTKIFNEKMKLLQESKPK